jgi:hypothetical protein
MQFSGSVVISQAAVIHFKRALHRLLELQLVCKEVDSIPRFRALVGDVSIENSREPLCRFFRFWLKIPGV